MLYNDPKTFREDMLKGYVAAYPDYVVEVPGEIERLVVRRGPGDVLLLDYGPESFYASVSRVFYGVRRNDR